MQYRDYYKLLGVGKDAGPAAIKQAYRRLARRHHPDLNPGDQGAAERFKEIGEAYAVLSDPERRARYDQIGADWAERGGGFPGFTVRTGPGGVSARTPGSGTDFGPFGDFSSFFLHFFGPDSPFGPLNAAPGWHGVRPPGPPEPPAPTALEISLEEALRGAHRQIRTGVGDFRVRIPPGTRDGTRLRVRTPAGKVLLTVRIAPHPRFRRDGDDLEVEVPVAAAVARDGGESDVPTPDGATRIRVPAGVRAGAALRVRGRGMPRPGGGRGDLLARVRIEPAADAAPGTAAADAKETASSG